MKQQLSSYILVLSIIASPLLFADAARERNVDALSSARALGMGGATVSGVYDANALFINPALMPYAERSGLSANYYYNGFSERVTDEYKLSTAFVIRSGDTGEEWALGIGAKAVVDTAIPKYGLNNNALGEFLYADTLARVGFAFNVRSKALIGVAANLYTTVVDADTLFGGSASFYYSSTIIFDALRYTLFVDNLGGAYAANDALSTIFNLDNKFGASFGFNDASGAFSAGAVLSYAVPSKTWDWSLGAEFRVISFAIAPSASASEDYEFDAVADAFSEEDAPIVNGVFLRAGAHNLNPSLGAGLYLWHIRLDYGLSVDLVTRTGLTHALGLSLLF